MDTITAEHVRRVIKGVPKAKDEALREGLGGTFSYFKLGKALRKESMLDPAKLPSYERLAAYISSRRPARSSTPARCGRSERNGQQDQQECGEREVAFAKFPRGIDIRCHRGEHGDDDPGSYVKRNGWETLDHLAAAATSASNCLRYCPNAVFLVLGLAAEQSNSLKSLSCCLYSCHERWPTAPPSAIL